jgi:hypothetical protein
MVPRSPYRSASRYSERFVRKDEPSGWTPLFGSTEPIQEGRDDARGESD